jgi:hypothetical protein
MKCEDFEGLIVDYLDGKLDQKEAGLIEKHIETCERCLDEMKEMKQIMKAMSEEVPATPDDSVRINFYHMLHEEVKKNESKSSRSLFAGKNPRHSRIIYQTAAGIALFIAGAFLGMLIHTGIGSSQQREISELRSEINTLKKTTMFTMLKDGSSSYRIQAVGYAEELESPDRNVIDALVNTLNGDKNVNVRMAAAYALSKYANLNSVRDSLVNSLSLQSDPILQVTLINILVELREKNALKPIEKIISDDKTMQEVKSVAQDGVRHLL